MPRASADASSASNSVGQTLPPLWQDARAVSELATARFQGAGEQATVKVSHAAADNEKWRKDHEQSIRQSLAEREHWEASSSRAKAAQPPRRQQTRFASKQSTSSSVSTVEPLIHDADALNHRLKESVCSIRQSLSELAWEAAEKSKDDASEEAREAMTPSRAQAKQGALSRRHRNMIQRRAETHQVIKAPARAKIKVDQPEDSGDEEEKKHAETAQSESDSGQSGGSIDSDDGRGSSKGSSKADLGDTSPQSFQRPAVDVSALEDWRMDLASDKLHHLLDGFKSDERAEALFSLHDYCVEKTPMLKIDGQALDRLESQVAIDQALSDRGCENFLRTFDAREAQIHRLLNRYTKTLRGLAGMEEDDDNELTGRKRAIKEVLLGRGGLSSRQKSVIKMTSEEVLQVLVSMQDDINAQRALIEVEDERRKAYEHALKELSKEPSDPEGTGNPMKDAVTERVITEVRQWERDRTRPSVAHEEQETSSKENATTATLFAKEGAWEAITRLNAENVRLRKAIAEENTVKRDVLGTRNSGIVDVVLQAAATRPNAKKQTTQGRIAQDGAIGVPVTTREPWKLSKWRNYEVFTQEVQDVYEAELSGLLEDCMDADRQIAVNSELERFSNQVIPVLQEGVQRLANAARTASRSLHVPGIRDVENEETNNEFNEASELKETIIKKDREDDEAHQKEVARLKEKATQLEQDAKAIEEELEEMRDNVSREEQRQERLQDDIKRAREERSGTIGSQAASGIKAAMTKAEMERAIVRVQTLKNLEGLSTEDAFEDAYTAASQLLAKVNQRYMTMQCHENQREPVEAIAGNAPSSPSGSGTIKASKKLGLQRSRTMGLKHDQPHDSAAEPAPRRRASVLNRSTTLTSMKTEPQRDAMADKATPSLHRPRVGAENTDEQDSAPQVSRTRSGNMFKVDKIDEEDDVSGPAAEPSPTPTSAKDRWRRGSELAKQNSSKFQGRSKLIAVLAKASKPSSGTTPKSATTDTPTASAGGGGGVLKSPKSAMISALKSSSSTPKAVGASTPLAQAAKPGTKKLTALSASQKKVRDSIKKVICVGRLNNMFDSTIKDLKVREALEREIEEMEQQSTSVEDYVLKMMGWDSKQSLDDAIDAMHAGSAQVQRQQKETEVKGKQEDNERLQSQWSDIMGRVRRGGKSIFKKAGGQRDELFKVINAAKGKADGQRALAAQETMSSSSDAADLEAGVDEIGGSEPNEELLQAESTPLRQRPPPLVEDEPEEPEA